MAKRTCALDGCDKPHNCRGWCRTHYMQWKRTGGQPRLRATALDRFRQFYVVAESGCWMWTGSIDRGGYGVGFRLDGKWMRAHRAAYELLIGPIPEGLTLDHLCRVRSCVNPEHLEPVTIGVNTRRGDTFQARNAAKTHCPRGHAYVGDNLYVSPAGRRHCRTCRRRAAQERLAS